MQNEEREGTHEEAPLAHLQVLHLWPKGSEWAFTTVLEKLPPCITHLHWFAYAQWNRAHKSRPSSRSLRRTPTPMPARVAAVPLPRGIGLEVAVGARHPDEGEEDAEVVLELAREGSNGWI